MTDSDACGATGPMNPVAWCEIHVSDMARAKGFYSELLGLAMHDMGMPGMEMTSFTAPDSTPRPGASGALVKAEGMAPGAGGTLVYFATLDCGRTADRAAELGGRIVTPKTDIGGGMGHFAHINDSEGNLIGLYSMG